MITLLRRAAVMAGLSCCVLSIASTTNAAPRDASASDAPLLSAGLTVERAPTLPPPRYPAGALHSPMTRGVVARLRAVLDRSAGRRNVFVKIGDSNTVNTSFLRCFAGADVRLGEHAALGTTLSFFGAHRIGDRATSYDRETRAATIGWLAGNVLGGAALRSGSASAVDSSPLAREIDEAKPAFAVIMLGTNDNRAGGVAPFAQNLAEVVDRTLALGVIPLLSTIPPRTDSHFAAARVPELNAVIRALAEDRQVPLMDLHAALLPLPHYGLASDGIHLQMAYDGAPHGCWLTPGALRRGMNVRNLLTLTALDRARRFLVDGEPPEDAR